MQLVTRLEKAACKEKPVTERVVRYLGMHGLAPTHQPTTHGDSALFGAFDLFLLRLFVRLRHEGVVAWNARAILLYLREQMRAELDAGRAPVLELRGSRGIVRDASMGAAPASSFGPIQLRPLADSSLRAVSDYRATRPELFAAWRWSRAAVVGAQVAAHVDTATAV